MSMDKITGELDRIVMKADHDTAVVRVDGHDYVVPVARCQIDGLQKLIGKRVSMVVAFAEVT